MNSSLENLGRKAGFLKYSKKKNNKFVKQMQSLKWVKIRKYQCCQMKIQKLDKNSKKIVVHLEKKMEG